MRRGERGRTRIRASIGRCLLVVRDTAHLLEGRRGSRRRGKVIGAIARPLMSLQTREWNLILMTSAEGGGLGRIACPLMNSGSESDSDDKRSKSRLRKYSSSSDHESSD
ncbi:hypothetical protein POTOM_028926 [Populus tomentosa]|uniref:Uncharacterized protein n=1 Tax=Populus tomentosa TaxID=118781 RepID=A0A8X7ZH33_POPTO|nr:hypothetical protein POTOM_028926 [Populus tomentosa]